MDRKTYTGRLAPKPARLITMKRGALVIYPIDAMMLVFLTG